MSNNEDRAARLAEIRTALTDLDEVVEGVSGVKGRYGWRFSGTVQHVNMYTDLKWALSELERVKDMRAAEDADAPHWAHAVLPEEIVRQRAHGWPDFHPEHYCHRCGRRNAIWWVDGDLWQAATAGRRRGILEILCPSCFVDLYEESTGEGHSWRLLPDVASVHEEAASGMPRPPAEAADVHDYLSTACHHGVHDHCRSATNIDGGTKKPGTCKFCTARCRCDCHLWSVVETIRQRWEAATMLLPHQERSVD